MMSKRTKSESEDTMTVSELFCEWTDCNQMFTDLTLYLQHLHKCHAIENKNNSEDIETINQYSCQWIGCEENNFDNYPQFCLHVSYHGFHQKLMSNGLAVMKKLGDSINCFMDCSARNVLPELPKAFVCGWEECFTDFTDSESFYRHVNRHAIEDVAIPSISKEELKRTKFAKCLWIGCKSAFTSRSHLRGHLRTHTQEKLIACPSCGAMFCNRIKFVDHLHRQTTNTNKSDSFTIHVSKGDDQSMTTLTIQMPQTDDSPQIALNSGNTPSILIQNLNSENELLLIDLTANSSLSTFAINSTAEQKSKPAVKKLFSCRECSRQFATQSLLSEHSRIHINKYKCTECPMATSSPSALRHHINYRHRSDRPFECQFCDLKFKSRSDLRRHIDTHSSEPPFRCAICGFHSRSFHTFSKHNKEHHLAIKCLYECHQCKKKFSRGNNLTRHLITLHKYVLPVSSCRFQYEKQEDGVYRLANKSMQTDIET